jgi:hypothetical protein
MHPPLDEWDAAYLATIAATKEAGNLEKNASAKLDTRAWRAGIRRCYQRHQ